MVKILIPEFYIALVLDSSESSIRKKYGDPTRKHIESLRQPTCDWLTASLKPMHPRLERIELPFAAIEIGSKKPEPRFHLYWQVLKPVAYFDVSISDMRTPDPQEFFDEMAEHFNKSYCKKVFRGTDISNSPLGAVIEVQVQRLKPKMTEGGSVQMPPFYVAFVCETPPTRQLNDKEKKKLTEHTHKHALKHLKNAYPPDEFSELNIKVTKTEINENAGKPTSNMNLYVQFEGTATFLKNAPEDAMLVFRPLTNCMCRDFLAGTRDCDGPILGDVIKMAIRVVVFSELDVPVRLRRGTLDVDVHYVPVKIHIEFFVALVVRELDALPKSSDLKKLDELIHEFFERCIHVWYPDLLIDIKLESEPEFEAGRPLPRFNMLHQYHAVMRFQNPPDPAEVLTKIVNCNVVALLSHINGNSTMWKRTAEVTLGRGLAPLPSDHIYGAKIDALKQEEKKKKAANNKKSSLIKKKPAAAPKEKENEPEQLAPLPAPVPKKKMAPKKRASAPARPIAPKVSPPRPPKEPTPAPKEEAPAAKPKPKKVSKAPPKRMSVPVKPVSSAPPKKVSTPAKPASKAPPKRMSVPVKHVSKAPPKRKSVPVKPSPGIVKEKAKDKEDEDGVRVSTSDVYLSLTLSNCDKDPSPKEYDKLVKGAKEFYTWHLTNVYGANFQEVDVSIHHKEWDTGKVDEKYNVYVEWDIQTKFKDPVTAPDRHKLCAALIKLDLMKLLIDYIRTIKATPFQDATAIFTQQVNS